MTTRFVLGAGMTGLGAGAASGFPVLEQASRPGGICASYEREGYRFELGGGHWIFGGDEPVARLLGCASELRTYVRRSAVMFLGGEEATRDLRGILVPYPIQDNLWALPAAIRQAALAEVLAGPTTPTAPTMAGWLRECFGETLCRVFFDPFHQRYTAGLFTEIAPQDPFKTPIDRRRVTRGATSAVTEAGYNATFLYPAKGLDAVSAWLAGRCSSVDYGAGVTQIGDRELHLVDGRILPFSSVMSTLPLNVVTRMAGLEAGIGGADPFTSVLVLNLGVTLPDTPIATHGCHWLYVPDSRSGFHRIGYYSNVDTLFLPAGKRDARKRASLYIECARRGGDGLTREETEALTARIVSELRDAGLIDEVEVADATWIDVAYTWKRPGSDWVARAVSACRTVGVESIGRYGRWTFQGIAASLREGLVVGSCARHC